MNGLAENLSERFMVTRVQQWAWRLDLSPEWQSSVLGRNFGDHKAAVSALPHLADSTSEPRPLRKFAKDPFCAQYGPVWAS
jgi:hypothetical protein